MMYGYGDGHFSGGWILMILMMLPIWGLLVLGCLVLYRSAGHVGVARPVATGRAHQILEERYASGEIDADELAVRRATLAGHQA